MLLDDLYMKMMEYYGGDPARLQHFVKVHSFSRIIGIKEGLSGKEQLILEAAAYVHDIGIKPAEEKFGSSAGPYQEKEGPSVAEAMLGELGFAEDVISRVSYLVGHHHTYKNIDGMDYQILVEADFLVNLFEDHVSKAGIRHAYDSIFKTETGKKICREMYQIQE